MDGSGSDSNKENEGVLHRDHMMSHSSDTLSASGDHFIAAEAPAHDPEADEAPGHDPNAVDAFAQDLNPDAADHAPNAADAPDSPEVPDSPEDPNSPEDHGSPEDPDSPEGHDGPEDPDSSEDSGCPEDPDSPEVRIPSPGFRTRSHTQSAATQHRRAVLPSTMKLAKSRLKSLPSYAKKVARK